MPNGISSKQLRLAPQSGPAHYNYALALNALGDSEVARQHFLAAADLSPGDKINLGFTGALAPYGNPEIQEPHQGPSLWDPPAQLRRDAEILKRMNL